MRGSGKLVTQRGVAFARWLTAQQARTRGACSEVVAQIKAPAAMQTAHTRHSSFLPTRAGSMLLGRAESVHAMT